MCGLGKQIGRDTQSLRSNGCCVERRAVNLQIFKMVLPVRIELTASPFITLPVSGRQQPPCAKAGRSCAGPSLHRRLATRAVPNP